MELSEIHNIKLLKELIKREEDQEHLTDGQMREKLYNMIEDHENMLYAGHTSYVGTIRNNTIKSIVNILNGLQNDLTFQSKYKITYEETEK